jgi:hypothetical protein
MADGVRGVGRSVRTVGCFTDGHGRAAPAAVSAGGVPMGRACIPGVSARRSEVIPVGRIGTGGALMDAAVREA